MKNFKMFFWLGALFLLLTSILLAGCGGGGSSSGGGSSPALERVDVVKSGNQTMVKFVFDQGMDVRFSSTRTFGPATIRVGWENGQTFVLAVTGTGLLRCHLNISDQPKENYFRSSGGAILPYTYKEVNV